ncbi:MAG: conjugative transposon protein TraM [Bacteroidetes bacterium]|nr:conjugative transposon protein TraM [Bacteroidota bacterium]
MKGKKIIIYIGISGLALLLINIFSIIASKKRKNKEEYLFEEPKLKRNKEEIKKKISKYQRILKELNEDEESKLSYRVKVKKENPFFGFFKARKQENKQVKKPINSKKIKKVLKQGIISHRIHESENEFYEAKIEQTQTIKNGKPIKIILKESIPTLEINSGTELRGIARIQGTRIMLQLTSYIVSDRKHLNFCILASNFYYQNRFSYFISTYFISDRCRLCFFYNIL